ncbi:hypothetical protein DPV78_008153 [Talaromyces pinophilus]|nr:hypothetical protein DPV78_008153 [Talaromyces pinophilus]
MKATTRLTYSQREEESKSGRKMKLGKTEWLVRTLAQIGQAQRGGSAPSPLGVDSGSRSRLPADDMSDLCIPSIDTQTTEQNSKTRSRLLLASRPGLLERRLFALRHIAEGVFRANQIPLN